MLTIYTVTYNEEVMLPYFIRHYRANFPGCRIIIYDNESTDATVKIALAAGAQVITYHTNHQLDDMKYLEIKNHCWQGQNGAAIHPCPPPEGEAERQRGGGGDHLTDWAIIADCDELVQLTEHDLIREEIAGANIIRFQGYDMVNLHNNLDVHNITHGVANNRYSKLYCFNTKSISQINYAPGCHDANPVPAFSSPPVLGGVPEGGGGKAVDTLPEIVYSSKTYPAYHYRYLDPAYLYRRYAQNKLRMCENNKKKGMGSQYFQSQHQIQQDFDHLRPLAQPIRQPMPADGLKVFITYYQHEQLHRIPGALHLTPVNLSQLQLPAGLQDNRLSEHRLFLSDILDNEHCPYLGNLTWRWFQKNRFMIPLENTWQLYRAPQIVWAAWPDTNWYRKSCIDHPGIQKYLDELIEFANSPELTAVISPPDSGGEAPGAGVVEPLQFTTEGTGPLANQFICSNLVFKQFQAFFRACFNHFHKKYGFSYDFDMAEKYKPNYQDRLPALFYERFAALYFANRTDLILKQIPNR